MSVWTARVLTLFPEMFPGPLGYSLAGRALAAENWGLATIDIRDFATDAYRTTIVAAHVEPIVTGSRDVDKTPNVQCEVASSSRKACQIPALGHVEPSQPPRSLGAATHSPRNVRH